jgi:DNA-binding NarL/FixJ family response regulator
MPKDLAPCCPTAREQQVLEMIWEGYSTKNIAYMLGISFKTAAIHRQRLLDKAGAHESITLLRWAIQNGHISPGTHQAQSGSR